MKNILFAFLLSLAAFAHAQIVTVPIPGAPGLQVTVGTGANALPLQDIKNNPNAVNITMPDDAWQNVPLGFDFPFYGKTFNNSWAMTNGVVTFQDPVRSGAFGLCCEGVDLTTTTHPRYNYSIYGLHSDLYSWNNQQQYYLRQGNSMTYGWYGLSQCCNSQGGNSFEIKIDSTGLVDTRIAGALVSWNRVTSGMAGDLSKGEYYQYYHGQGINIVPGSSNIFSWQALGGTGQGIDQCTINPLFNPSCPGYAAAYLSQQCTISALYNPSCPGYAEAYFTQQCTLNQLYNVNCPGYAAAYLAYQCSLDALYSTTCPGYEQAYFNQQCTISGLYSRLCPNYETAYFNQQCQLNGLYSRTCPNYAEAYATKMALENSKPPSTNNTTTSRSTQETPTPSISSDGSVKTEVSKTGDSNVDKAIESPSPSTNSAAAPAAPVQLSQPSNNQQPVAAAVIERRQERQEKQEEKKDASSTGPSSSSNNQTASSQETKPSGDQPKTARQELQERRVEAARAKAVEDGKNLAGNMGKAASLEQQVAVQTVVIQAMGFTPGFDAYGKVFVPDGVGYKPFTVYNNQRNVDNARLGRGLFGPTDRLHDQMVSSQYERKE